MAEGFTEKKLHFNQSSLEILPSRTAECDRTPVGLSGGKVFSWVTILQMLGCFLAGMGSTEAQVRGRLQQGRKMCTRCCVSLKFRRKNVRVRFIQRSGRVYCAAPAVGLRQ